MVSCKCILSYLIVYITLCGYIDIQSTTVDTAIMYVFYLSFCRSMEVV